MGLFTEFRNFGSLEFEGPGFGVSAVVSICGACKGLSANRRNDFDCNFCHELLLASDHSETDTCFYLHNYQYHYQIVIKFNDTSERT